MIARAFRGPHNLYRRYQALLESTATAVGLAVLVTLALLNLSVYPYNWVLVIGLGIAVLGIRWPLAAYLVAVAAMVYPIFTINFYLAVLFLGISALSQRVCVHYLGAAVLILATPALAEYHLHWLVPILAGLWWGGASGAWIGALAATWGKVLGGMAGMNIDWLSMAGQAPQAGAIVARFQEANSLETLLLLVEPFAATSGVILYNLLQVIGWAVAAGFVGSLAGRKWVKYRAPWSILVLTAGGGLIMLGTHLGLPYWLNEAVTDNTIAALKDPTGPLFSLIVVIIVSTTIHSLRETLDLPVAPPQTLSSARRYQGEKQKTAESGPIRLFRGSARSPNPAGSAEPADFTDFDRPRQPVRVPHYSELPEWEPPRDDP
ncbi:MAG TPA: hypothetical protein VEC93_16765, partial [Anaerolineae bacterium]|nr:hypothetical protein [Anaerolineae bacterium]